MFSVFYTTKIAKIGGRYIVGKKLWNKIDSKTQLDI